MIRRTRLKQLCFDKVAKTCQFSMVTIHPTMREFYDIQILLLIYTGYIQVSLMIVLLGSNSYVVKVGGGGGGDEGCDLSALNPV